MELERDEDGRLLLNKRPGRHRSTALVRSLRLQRLKQTTMSRTAALDVRKAAVLGETKLPKAKVYGKKKGAFSDLSKMLSSSSQSTTTKASSPKAMSSAGTGGRGTTQGGEDEDDEMAPVELTADQKRAALILSVKDRKPLNARHIGRKDLSEFQKTFDHKTYMDFKTKMNQKIEDVTTSIRSKHEKRRKELDEAGFFHPAANAMRCESAFQNELQKKLSLDQIETIVLDEMLRESRGEVLNKKTSKLDSKFDNMLKLNAGEESKTKASSGKTKKTERKGILKKSSTKATSAANATGASSKNSPASNSSGVGSGQKQGEGGRKEGQVESAKVEDKLVKAVDQGPAAKLQKDVESKVSDATKAELKKRISDRHVLDRGQQELDEEEDIWDNSDDEESEVDEKAGEAHQTDGEDREEDDDEEPVESKFASNWDNEIALDDGEGSDIGSELTEEMNHEEVVVVKKKKKVKLDSFEKFRIERQKQVREKKIKRNVALREGKLNETVTDEDFIDLSKHRSSTIQVVLGSGNHSIKRVRAREFTLVGEKAVNAPLPKHVHRQIKSMGGKRNQKKHKRAKEKAALEAKRTAEEAAAKTKREEEAAVSEDDSDLEYSEEEEDVGEGDDGLQLTEEEKASRLENKRKRAAARRKKRREQQKNNEADGEPLIRRTLEQVWKDLEMPNNLKVEFAIKYSDPSRSEELADAIPRWHKAAMGVCMREMLLETVRYLIDMKEKNEFVSLRFLFTEEQVEKLTALDVFIPKEDMYDASALTWVQTMEENLRPVVKELILELKDYHEDTLTFRGQKYIKILKDQMENPSLLPGEPVLYSGNPYLRRTGKLLLTR